LARRHYDAADPYVTLTAAAAATGRPKLAAGIQRDTIQTAKLVSYRDREVSASTSPPNTYIALRLPPAKGSRS
jgi:hypothetical protein